MKKAIVEFIGTFFLVLTVCFAVTGAGYMAPVAIGLVLIVMIYAGGYISGAHYNPAVSLAMAVRGNLSWSEIVVYWVSQFLAGALASLLYIEVFNGVLPSVIMGSNRWVVVLAELLFTFTLVYVIFHTATGRNSNNSFYGLAIGFTVTAGAYAVGSISGGVFNPAVGLGLVINGAISMGDIWMHILGQVLGSLLAVVVYNYVSTSNNKVS